MSDNQTKAADSFRKAAEGGDPEGQFQYALCLRDGRGVSKDLVEASKWLEKAANSGHLAATNALSELQKSPATPSSGIPETKKSDKGAGCCGFDWTSRHHLAYLLGVQRMQYGTVTDLNNEVMSPVTSTPASPGVESTGHMEMAILCQTLPEPAVVIYLKDMRNHARGLGGIVVITRIPRRKQDLFTPHPHQRAGENHRKQGGGIP